MAKAEGGQNRVLRDEVGEIPATKLNNLDFVTGDREPIACFNLGVPGGTKST